MNPGDPPFKSSVEDLIEGTRRIKSFVRLMLRVRLSHFVVELVRGYEEVWLHTIQSFTVVRLTSCLYHKLCKLQRRRTQSDLEQPLVPGPCNIEISAGVNDLRRLVIHSQDFKSSSLNLKS